MGTQRKSMLRASTEGVIIAAKTAAHFLYLYLQLGIDFLYLIVQLRELRISGAELRAQLSNLNS